MDGPWRDAHLHLLELGESLRALHLGACTSIDDVLRALARADAELPKRAWLVARGLQPERLTERRLPSAREIDQAVGDRPCALRTLDLHSMAVSTAALRAAGLLDQGAPAAPGRSLGGDVGLVERDAAGAPTGVLLEAASGHIERVLPAPSPDQRVEQLREGIDQLRAHGIVEAHEMFARAEVVQALLTLQHQGELDGVRIKLYAARDHLPEVQACLAHQPPDAPVQLGGLKLFLDGTLNSRTAFMLGPFADPLPAHPHGMATYSLAEVLDELHFAQASGLDVAAHAIGDAAVRQALDAHDEIERALGGDPTVQLRIEHAQFIDPADVERFARRGKARPIVASMQPCHLLADMEPIMRLLPDRASRAFAMRDLVEAAMAAGREPASCIWLGSDAPVVWPAPDDNRQACVHRRRTDMPSSAAIAPEQAIDNAMWAQLQAPLTEVHHAR